MQKEQLLSLARFVHTYICTYTHTHPNCAGAELLYHLIALCLKTRDSI